MFAYQVSTFLDALEKTEDVAVLLLHSSAVQEALYEEKDAEKLFPFEESSNSSYPNNILPWFLRSPLGLKTGQLAF